MKTILMAMLTAMTLLALGCATGSFHNPADHTHGPDSIAGHSHAVAVAGDCCGSCGPKVDKEKEAEAPCCGSCGSNKTDAAKEKKAEEPEAKESDKPKKEEAKKAEEAQPSCCGSCGG